MTTRNARFGLGGAGVPAMLWAGWLVLRGGAATDSVRVSIWLVDGLVLHDALVIGVLTLASIPLMLGRGRRPDTPAATPSTTPTTCSCSWVAS